MTHAISEDIAHTTIKAFYLTEKDVDLLRQVVTPDWEYIPEPPGAKPGADQMADAFERMTIALPDMEITILDLLIHGDRVGVRAEVTGTQSGELLGMASSAKQIKFAIHSFHQLRGPLVAKTWHLEDRISVFGQIGQLPKHLDARRRRQSAPLQIAHRIARSRWPFSNVASGKNTKTSRAEFLKSMTVFIEVSQNAGRKFTLPYVPLELPLLRIRKIS